MDDPDSRKNKVRLIYYLVFLSALIGILGLFVAIKGWDTSNNYELPHEPQSTEETTEQLPEFEITGHVPKRTCLLVIRTSYDNLPQGEEVWCSVSGKNGPYYENKTDSVTHKLFSASGLKAFNIWAAFRGDTVSYIRNGDKIEGFGCN